MTCAFLIGAGACLLVSAREIRRGLHMLMSGQGSSADLDASTSFIALFSSFALIFIVLAG